MATERAQEVAGGIGLRTILCQAAQVHAVPATSGEGDGQLVCYGSRLQALQADTTTLVVGASWVGWGPVSALTGGCRWRDRTNRQRGRRRTERAFRRV